MKRKLTKAEFDALTPEMKLLYVADGDGFKLPLVDDDDPDALRRARDREKEAKKDAKKEIERLQAQLDALNGDPSRRTQDVVALEASWKKKFSDRETELTGQLTKANDAIKTILVENASGKIASAITASPESAAVMLPHILPRLEVIFDGDSPSVKVKGADGKLSAMSTEDLQKEFQSNKTFEKIVIVSRGSGAGSTGSGSGSGNGGAGGATSFAEMSEAQRTELYRSNPAEFTRQMEAQPKGFGRKIA